MGGAAAPIPEIKFFMAKTQVILIENVPGLGAESDQIKVASGYARNFLIPNKLAVPLTATNKRRLEALRQRRGDREAHELNTMMELGRSISKLTAVLSVKTGDDGRMFGSVTAADIAGQLHQQFEINLDKRKIHLEHPIRTLGEHEVALRLHPEVNATLKVRVESSTPLPEKPAVPAEEQRGRGRSPRPFRGGAGRPGPGAPAESPETPQQPARAERPDRRPKKGPVKDDAPKS